MYGSNDLGSSESVNLTDFLLFLESRGKKWHWLWKQVAGFLAASWDEAILPVRHGLPDASEQVGSETADAVLVTDKGRARAKRMKMSKFALRVRDKSNSSEDKQMLAYWLASRRCFSEHAVVGCAFDASRCGGKNYLFGFGTCPDGVGAFLPPQARDLQSCSGMISYCLLSLACWNLVANLEV